MIARRKLALAVVVLAVAVAASTPILGAVFTNPALEALADVAVLGKTTPLLVQVDPSLVGGTGLLYATQDDGSAFRLGKFILTDTSFVMQAPVPATATAGETLTYYFRYGGVEKGPSLTSGGAPVYVLSSSKTDEPPIWD
jgi:hypothetical protein